jgi:hypothetical protein
LILEKDDDDDDIAVPCRLITSFTTFSRKAALRGDDGFCRLSLKVVSTYLKAVFEFFAGSMVMKRDHIIGNLRYKYVL